MFMKADTVPLLDISIDGYRIWTLAGKSRQKIVTEEAALKIEGCMHPLPKLRSAVAPVVPALAWPCRHGQGLGKNNILLALIR